ncbi:MAG: metallophosphoesterase [Polyangiaceae bacterium]|nr:metallophosphoesterase [Polyangiaceae bacterium]
MRVAATDLEGSILLVSDVHAQYQVVQQQLDHAEGALDRRVAQVLVLGDFGVFAPNLHAYFRRGRRRFTRPVAFIEGNHEDFRDFDHLAQAYADVVTHLPRGSQHRFGRWGTVCIGGARYMDAWSTPQGSEITERDVAACLAHDPAAVDVVISHDCPSGIGVASAAEMAHLGPPGDPGLARVAVRLRPRYWVFGHHHRWHDSERYGTRFVGLPQSWEGYALLHGDGDLERVDHVVELPRPSGFWRWLGMR